MTPEFNAALAVLESDNDGLTARMVQMERAIRLMEAALAMVGRSNRLLWACHDLGVHMHRDWRPCWGVRRKRDGSTWWAARAFWLGVTVRL